VRTLHCRAHKKFYERCTDCIELNKEYQRTTHQPISLDVFLKALTEYYPNDPLQPGIVTAWLPAKKQFYTSIVRYMRYTKDDAPYWAGSGEVSWRTSKCRTIVCRAYGETLDSALDELLRTWRRIVAPAQQPKRNLDAVIDWEGEFTL
jgi:hypothetical protein